MAPKEKYLQLLNKSFAKFSELECVDTDMKPVPRNFRKYIQREILKQLNNNKYNVDGLGVEIETKKPVLRRKKKYIVSKESKLKLHLRNFKREINNFTEEEDLKILQAMEASKGKKLMISELCKSINRPYHSTRDRVRKFRNKSNNKISFSLVEDKIILDEVLQYIRQERLREIPLPNPLKLSLQLKRRETSLKSRWQYYLKPMILQYYTKTLNLDVRYMLVNHVADNYPDLISVDWEKVVKVPEFSGHTDSSIRYQLSVNMCSLTYSLKE